MRAFLWYWAMLHTVSGGGAAAELIHIQLWSPWVQNWTLTAAELQADDVCSNALFATMNPWYESWSYTNECIASYDDDVGFYFHMWTMLHDGKARYRAFNDADCTTPYIDWTYNSTCTIFTSGSIRKVEVVQDSEVGRLELFSDSNCTQEVTSDGAGEPFPTDTCIHYSSDLLQFSCGTDGVSTIDWWNRTNWQDETCPTPNSVVNCKFLGDGVYGKYKCPDATTTSLPVSKAHETWSTSLAWVLALSAWIFLA